MTNPETRACASPKLNPTGTIQAGQSNLQHLLHGKSNLLRAMEKWKANSTSHFSTPTTAAASSLTHLPRYTNNLAGTKYRADQAERLTKWR
jgi:hypothetical protein